MCFRGWLALGAGGPLLHVSFSSRKLDELGEGMLCAARGLVNNRSAAGGLGLWQVTARGTVRHSPLLGETGKLKPRQGKAGLRVSLRGTLVSGIRVDVP